MREKIKPFKSSCLYTNFFSLRDILQFYRILLLLLVHVYTCSIYTTEYKSSEKAVNSQI